jgi:hypothetical protein
MWNRLWPWASPKTTQTIDGTVEPDGAHILQGLQGHSYPDGSYGRDGQYCGSGGTLSVNRPRDRWQLGVRVHVVPQSVVAHGAGPSKVQFL